MEACGFPAPVVSQQGAITKPNESGNGSLPAQSNGQGHAYGRKDKK